MLFLVCPVMKSIPEHNSVDRGSSVGSMGEQCRKYGGAVVWGAKYWRGPGPGPGPGRKCSNIILYNQCTFYIDVY